MSDIRKHQKKQANFFLSAIVIDNLRSHVPKGEQSQFVELAIERALSRIRFQDALKTSFGSWKGNRHPHSEQFIRTLRHSKRPLR
ncbi:MAG: hypothetical protein Q8O95_02800 [bacterium]|nr:hypothetical protein [bacterium]